MQDDAGRRSLGTARARKELNDPSWDERSGNLVTRIRVTRERRRTNLVSPFGSPHNVYPTIFEREKERGK